MKKRFFAAAFLYSAYSAALCPSVNADVPKKLPASALSLLEEGISPQRPIPAPGPAGPVLAPPFDFEKLHEILATGQALEPLIRKEAAHWQDYKGKARRMLDAFVAASPSKEEDAKYALSKAAPIEQTRSPTNLTQAVAKQLAQKLWTSATDLEEKQLKLIDEAKAKIQRTEIVTDKAWRLETLTRVFNARMLCLYGSDMPVLIDQSITDLSGKGVPSGRKLLDEWSRFSFVIFKEPSFRVVIEDPTPYFHAVDEYYLNLLDTPPPPSQPARK